MLLALIVLLAVWLRVRGLAYGLPAVYNPDEVAIMSRALAFAKGDLNPHNFLYPTFYFYLLFGWIGVYFIGALMAGAVESLRAFQDSFFIDPTPIYLAGRTLTMLCGVATVAAVYLLGRRLWTDSIGIVAAFLLAVSPIHVMDSHYVKHDVPVTLAIVVAHLAILALAGAPQPVRLRRAVAAGVACGVALATHYYAVFVLVPLALALAIGSRTPERIATARAAIAAGAGVVAAFFVLSPFVVLEAGTTWRDVVANRQIVMDRATGEGGWFSSLGRHFELLGMEAFGMPVAVLAVVGIGLAVRARLKPGTTNQSRLTLGTASMVMLLAFPLPFLLFIGNTVPATRYLNPILPFMAILAAVTISSLPAFLRGVKPAQHGLILAAVTLLVAAPALARSVKIGSFFQEADTRTLARRFVERDIQSGATILLQPYSVPLRQSREGLVEALGAHYGDVRRASTKFALQLQLSPYPSPAYRLLYLGENGLDMDKLYVGYAAVSAPDGLETLRRLGVQYVVIKRYNVPDPATQPLIGLLEARPREAHRLATFSPYRRDLAPGAAARVEPFLHNTDAQVHEALERPGPMMEIWELSRK